MSDFLDHPADIRSGEELDVALDAEEKEVAIDVGLQAVRGEDLARRAAGAARLGRPAARLAEGGER